MTLDADAVGTVPAPLNQSRPLTHPPPDIKAISPAYSPAQSCSECETSKKPYPCCIESCSTCEEDIPVDDPVVCHGLCPEGVCSDDSCADGPARDEWICEDENCNAQMPGPSDLTPQLSRQWINAMNWKPITITDTETFAPSWTSHPQASLHPGFSGDGYDMQYDAGGRGFAPVVPPAPVSLAHQLGIRLDQSPKPHVCLWQGCSQSFSSIVELVTHVNLAHVPLTVPPVPSAPSPIANTLSDVPALDCHWGDCQNALTWTTSSDQLQWTPESDFEALTRHFMQEHLGLPPEVSHVHTTDCEHERKEIPPSPMQSVYHLLPTSSTSDSPSSTTGSSLMLSNLSSPISPTTADPPSPSGSKDLPCLWNGCKENFVSSESLMGHLADVHVGSGHSSYECHWADCDRQGSKSFSSKQKVLRHLQAHTAYRPFKCQQCGQFFSEAATLQQHARRHTNERPFVCDFPGCGKAFSITGALTIHKRVHSGDRPFKCKYCDRSFSESSNLTKHLRVHTGARPYACAEPGCGKRFSRPDQLSRHAATHQKRPHTSS